MSFASAKLRSNTSRRVEFIQHSPCCETCLDVGAAPLFYYKYSDKSIKSGGNCFKMAKKIRKAEPFLIFQIRLLS